METVGFWSVIIGLILIAISYIYYQAIDARVRTFEIRMKDEMLKIASTQNAVNVCSDAVRDMRAKVKELREEYEKDSESLDFSIQEIIRLDRELSKLRPIVKVLLPKEPTEEKKKKTKTTH